MLLFFFQHIYITSFSRVIALISRVFFFHTCYLRILRVFKALPLLTNYILRKHQWDFKMKEQTKLFLCKKVRFSERSEHLYDGSVHFLPSHMEKNFNIFPRKFDESIEYYARLHSFGFLRRSLIIQSKSITHREACNHASHPRLTVTQKTLVSLIPKVHSQTRHRMTLSRANIFGRSFSSLEF